MEHELNRLRLEAAGIANTTAHFMGLAEEYIRQGNTESARACLILLCENCDNYEESLEWNGLLDTWQQHRHLVDGLVPPSVHLYSAKPLLPQECTMPIGDIFALCGADLLSALSTHLGELSSNGDALGCLNKWERTAYYADELCSEVNSGGFDSYLYYHGTHFEQARKAIDTIHAPEMGAILDSVRGKFPKNRIPKSENALQNAMDTMEEQGLDFEAEDAHFYASGEKQLLKQLLSFVRENQRHFR